MQLADLSSTSQSTAAVPKFPRSERNAEISRTVTAVRDGNAFVIEPVSSNESEATSSAPTSKAIFRTDFRSAVQLTSYVALCRDATTLNVDLLSQRLITPQFGAVATFVGISRRDWHPETGAATNRLVYEAYEQMALKELDRVCMVTQGRFGVSIAIVHRVGEVLLAEPSITCVCAAPHRDAAFDALRFAVAEVKAKVPIWKCEHFEDGSSRWLANSECCWTAGGARNNLDSLEPGSAGNTIVSTTSSMNSDGLVRNANSCDSRKFEESEVNGIVNL